MSLNVKPFFLALPALQKDYEWDVEADYDFCRFTFNHFGCFADIEVGPCGYNISFHKGDDSESPWFSRNARSEELDEALEAVRLWLDEGILPPR